MTTWFLANINIEGGGGVVASPDVNTPGGSYYYHWERDASLSMRALMITSGNIETVLDYMQSYVKWVINAQGFTDPFGNDVRTEPKYLLPYGPVFPGGWCRPQTDGPALRAATLIVFANWLLQNGQASYVSEYLWTGNPNKYNGGAIKYDLDWVAANWTTTTCDLWEEIRSDDLFWNRYAFKHALLNGAQFASTMGDSQSAHSYTSSLQAVNSTLLGHWNGQFLFEDQNRQMDAAVIAALNNHYDDGDLFTPTSTYVAQTVAAYNTMFCNQYQINQIDTAAGIPGMLYGRYYGDHYAGGNPWILSTANLARLFYRASQETAQAGLPDPSTLSTWVTALGLPSNQTIQSLAASFFDAGDSVLHRLHHHVKNQGGHLAEQIDRNTGVQESATDLTWSYAATLMSLWERDQASDLLQKL